MPRRPKSHSNSSVAEKPAGGEGSAVVRLVRGPRPEAVPGPAVSGSVLGRVVRLSKEGHAWVELSQGQPVCWKARSTFRLSPTDLAAEVLICWPADQDDELPVIVGKIQTPDTASRHELDVSLDGREIRLEAKRELVLRCGRASIHLHESGRVVIQGVTVVSRAKQANRVLGATVELN